MGGVFVSSTTRSCGRNTKFPRQASNVSLSRRMWLSLSVSRSLSGNVRWWRVSSRSRRSFSLIVNSMTSCLASSSMTNGKIRFSFFQEGKAVLGTTLVFHVFHRNEVTTYWSFWVNTSAFRRSWQDTIRTYKRPDWLAIFII